MAEPQLQIERRIRRVERQLAYQETAIRTLTQWLVNEYPNFDPEVMNRILNGEEEPEPE